MSLKNSWNGKVLESASKALKLLLESQEEINVDSGANERENGGVNERENK